MATLTPQEAAIMDRWDAGLSMQRIARSTGLPIATVQNTVSTYHSTHEDREFRAMIVRGSACLLQAIAVAHGGTGAAS